MFTLYHSTEFKRALKVEYYEKMNIVQLSRHCKFIDSQIKSIKQVGAFEKSFLKSIASQLTIAKQALNKKQSQT